MGRKYRKVVNHDAIRKPSRDWPTVGARVHPETRALLDLLAKRREVSVSDLVREAVDGLVDAEYRRAA